MNSISNFFKTHLLGVFLFSIFASLCASFIFYIVVDEGDIPKNDQTENARTEVGNDDNNRDRDSLFIRFSDGTHGLLSFYAKTELPSENASKIVSMFGDEDAAKEELDSIIRSHSISVLEKETYSYFRNNRETLSTRVKDLSDTEAKSNFMKVLSIRFLDFVPLRKKLSENLRKPSTQALIEEHHVRAAFYFVDIEAPHLVHNQFPAYLDESDCNRSLQVRTLKAACVPLEMLWCQKTGWLSEDCYPDKSICESVGDNPTCYKVVSRK